MRTDAMETPPEQRDRERAERRALVWRAVRYSLLAFVALRVGLSLLALAGVGVLPPSGNVVGVPGWPAEGIVPGVGNLVTAWERFDGLWFLSISSFGYDIAGESAAFFPGYPLAIRAVSPILGGHPLAAALLVSNLAAFGSFVLLYLLTALELEEDDARRAVVYLAVFPTSFFLLAPYSESLFLFLVLAALLAARRARWAIASVAGFAAAATRSLGVILSAAFVVEAIHQARERGGRWGRSLPWTLGPLLGLAAYLLSWQLRGGEWRAPLEAQETWQRDPLWPWVTVWRATVQAFGFLGQFTTGYHTLDWLVVVPVLVAAVWVALRTRPVYGVYAWLSIIAPLSYVFPSRAFMSMPRFLVVVFPILWAPAVLSRGRPGLHAALVGIGAGLLGLMTVLFVNWYYVF